MPISTLQTLSEAVQTYRANSKGKSRLEVKVEKGKASDKAWEDCKRIVDKRDGMKCRFCGVRVVRTLELDPKRAEHHHIARRAKEKALLTDPRNVVLVCLACHQKLTKHLTQIIGRAVDMFEHAGKKFLSADKPLQFIEGKS